MTVSFEGETTHSEEQQRGGWQAILENFKRHVEGGAAAGERGGLSRALVARPPFGMHDAPATIIVAGASSLTRLRMQPSG